MNQPSLVKILCCSKALWVLHLLQASVVDLRIGLLMYHSAVYISNKIIEQLYHRAYSTARIVTCLQQPLHQDA